MEELLAFALLLYEGIIEETEYNKRLDELFDNVETYQLQTDKTRKERRKAGR